MDALFEKELRERLLAAFPEKRSVTAGAAGAADTATAAAAPRKGLGGLKSWNTVWCDQLHRLLGSDDVIHDPAGKQCPCNDQSKSQNMDDG